MWIALLRETLLRIALLRVALLGVALLGVITTCVAYILGKAFSGFMAH